MITTTKRTAWRRKLLGFRDRFGLTQAEAASRIGVTKRAWIKWEREGVPPSLPFAILLEQLIRHPYDFAAGKLPKF